MGRRRLARSFQYFGRCYLYNLSVPSSKPIVSGINGRFPSCSAGISSPSECVQPTLLPRVLRVSSVTERRPEFATSRRSMMSQGLETSTMVASIDHDDYSRRVARSHSSMISTSGRTRGWCYEQRCGHTSGQNFEGKEKISVVFFDKDGEETKIQVPVGMSMLEAAHENDIELEVREIWKFDSHNTTEPVNLAADDLLSDFFEQDEDMYSRLPEPSDEENDMLDLAFGLTETSRLGCQVIAKPELDGLHLALPAATRNFAVDGHVPKPH